MFNFEGGCYAKVINLSQKRSRRSGPPRTVSARCWRTSSRDGHGRLDLTDGSLTENTRSCYPVEFIPNVELSGRGGQPKNVVMLTCDAFGVLPPIARLTPAQAMYHFLSGLHRAGRRHRKGPGRGAAGHFQHLLRRTRSCRAGPRCTAGCWRTLIARHGVDCWLVNTGWSGGQYGVGKRMGIRHTRALLRGGAGRQPGSNARFRKEPFFGLAIPEAVPGIPGRGARPSPGLGGQARL